MDDFRMYWSDIIPRKCRWSHECKWSWYTEVSEEKWSSQVSYFSLFECESWESMQPVFSREKWRKRRAKLGHRMSEFSSKGISITSRSCMTIGISSCRDDENVRFIRSLRSGDEVFLSFFFYEWYSLSIMHTYPITIFCEYFFESTDDIVSIIRNREYSIIFFTLQWYSVSFEPFSTLFRRKLPHCSLDESPSTSIFGRKDFLIRDSCGHIASSSSRYDDFFSGCCIFIEEMDMELLDSLLRKGVRGILLCILQYRHCRHESSSSRSDDRYRFHDDEYRENSRKRKSWQRSI